MQEAGLLFSGAGLVTSGTGLVASGAGLVASEVDLVASGIGLETSGAGIVVACFTGIVTCDRISRYPTNIYEMTYCSSRKGERSCTDSDGCWLWAESSDVADS